MTTDRTQIAFVQYTLRSARGVTPIRCVGTDYVGTRVVELAARDSARTDGGEVQAQRYRAFRYPDVVAQLSDEFQPL